MEAAIALRERGATFVNPCTGEMLLAGQGTVALEILGELPDLATLIAGVGGGGASADAPVSFAPWRRVCGSSRAERERGPPCRCRLPRAGRRDRQSPTLAEDWRVRSTTTRSIERHAIDDIVALSEADIARSIDWHGLSTSNAPRRRRLRGGYSGARKLERIATPAAVVVSGGNIDPRNSTGS
jgi:threonine dehydratase